MIDIDGKKGSKAFFLVQDKTKEFFPKKKSVIKSDFFKGFQPDSTNIDEFGKMVSESIQKDSVEINPADFEELLKVEIKIKIEMGDIKYREQLYEEALKDYFKAADAVVKLREQIETRGMNEDMEDYLEFRLVFILQKVGITCQDANEYHLAEKIFTHIKAVDLLCKCYERMIEKENDVTIKYNYMKMYAGICQRYGRNTKAIEIYQNMLDIFTFLPNKRRTIMDLLKECLSPVFQVSSDYMEYLGEHKRITISLQTLSSWASDCEILDPFDNNEKPYIDLEKEFQEDIKKAPV